MTQLQPAQFGNAASERVTTYSRCCKLYPNEEGKNSIKFDIIILISRGAIFTWWFSRDVEILATSKEVVIWMGVQEV